MNLNRRARSSSARSESAPDLSLLWSATTLLAGLMVGFAVWGVADGWILDTSGASDGPRAWFSLLALTVTLMSLGITRRANRPSSFS